MSACARLSRPLARACALAALLCASAAVAHGVPVARAATVTVRVEGLGGATLLSQTQVATTTAAVPVEGGSCAGTSAGGALFDATHGSWKARLEPEGVEIDGIEGLNFPAFKEHGDAYWAFWLNNQFAEHGACSEEVSNGADIVFAAQCIAIGPDCPSSMTAPDHFLTESTPSSSSVNVGEPVSVKVGSISTALGTPEGSLPPGVTVSGGAVSVTPGAQGVATLTFATPGTYTLQARAPDSVPSDPRAVCVHNGNDGTCGTSAPGAPAGASSPGTGGAHPSALLRYTGPFAVVASQSGLGENRSYRHGSAPRLLAGSVSAHTSVLNVSISLRRSYHGRCWAYNGSSERLVRARCGRDALFAVSSSASFSYLLPFQLPRGRYVFDIEATDAWGNRTALARGTSRTVFYVT
jgi:hypothetical protein